jgi:predicted phosphodiesterase
MNNSIKKFLMVMLLFVSISCAQSKLVNNVPDRIIITLTEIPTTSMAVNWRTTTEVSKSEVQVAEPTGWTDFEANTKSFSVMSKKILTDKKVEVYEHSAKMTDLKPNTLYAYRVGGDSVWSEWNQFRTAKDTVAPFKFVYFGDPQNDLKQHCSRVFREAFRKASDAAFWLFAGDITSEPEDNQYEGFFYAGGFIFGTTPSVIVPGNHDVEYLWQEGKIVRDKKGKKQRGTNLAELWLEQFTLPENGIPKYKESSYSIDYQGVRFIIINTNDEDSLSLQTEWMENLLANNSNKWTIVSFHHPLYSAGRDRDDDDTRNAFLPLFDKYSVDLVLTGHDHAYARSYKLKNGEVVDDDEKGTVYVVSVSGPKMYSVNSNYNNIMAKTGGNVQLFQTISVNGSKIKYESYTATGELYDSFELNK